MHLTHMVPKTKRKEISRSQQEKQGTSNTDSPNQKKKNRKSSE